MRGRDSFDFATIRVVPRVDREEFVNAGVIVFCLTQKFLGARIRVNQPRLHALWPELELETVAQHLRAIPDICAGNESAGPIARLSIRERFHWLVAPRSTVIQVSPVHTGLCHEPEALLEHLFMSLTT